MEHTSSCAVCSHAPVSGNRSALELRRLLVPGLAAPVCLRVATGGLAAVVLPDPVVARRFVRTLIGLEAPDSGEVLVHGTPVRKAGRPRAGHRDRRGVALVPAGGALLPHLTVAENIAYGRVHGEGLSYRQVAPWVESIATDMGIRDLLPEYPEQIGPGRRLQVGLARALLRLPRVVVLEERAPHPRWREHVTGGWTRSLEGTAALIVTDSRGEVDPIVDNPDDVHEPALAIGGGGP